MNLFEFKLGIMSEIELKQTLVSLKGQLNTANSKDKNTIEKMIKMTENKLAKH